MDTPNFLAAINQICDEKKIDKALVLEAIEEALKAAYRRDYGNRDQDLSVILDPDTGRASILMIKTIVESVENPHAEISLEDAQQIKKGIKAGTKLKIDVTPVDFGRVASQSAKQVILQYIQDAERQAIYDEYSDREDELLNALVHHMEGRFAHLELDRTQAVLEPRDQIAREKYRQGQRLKVYLERVEQTTRGPKLRLSRTHPRFIYRLMELEIPEVRNGVVVVKAIAREPGVRCKLVVDSTDPAVDPVGACVGQKGARIQNITDEVSGERIDVIQFTDDFEAMLRECLSPAKIDSFKIYEEEKRVEVFVAEDQRALAIGKSGQNVRLAGEIMGWEIDVLNTAELSGEVVVEEDTDDSSQTTEEGESETPASEETETPAEETTEETPATEAEEASAAEAETEPVPEAEEEKKD